MPATARKARMVQSTTVRLPRRLYEEATCAVKAGTTEASSLNDLLVDSLEEKLKQLKREQIDAEFADMKNDPKYQKETARIAEQFSESDGETIKAAEREFA